MREKQSIETLELILPILVLALLFLLGFKTLQPFLSAVLWGIFLSVSLRPFHDNVVGRTGGRRSLATLLTGLLMLLVLILPMIGLSRALIAFLPDAANWFSSSGAKVLSPEHVIDAVSEPSRGDVKSFWNVLLWDIQFIRDYFDLEVRPVVNWVFLEGKLIGTFVVEFALGVLVATVLLHRAQPMSKAFRQFAERVGGEYASRMIDRAVVTVRSTVFGLLGSAAAQTAVASIAYIFVGAPHWPILALVTFVLGLVQIGPIFVWLPLCVWLWLDAEIGLSIALALWGLVVVGLTDNLVKTAVMARGADMPALLAFLGAIGGFLSWGMVGIFLGPVIVAVCYQLTLSWLKLTQAEPSSASDQ